jgi:CheY-like chemotaxis protein
MEFSIDSSDDSAAEPALVLIVDDNEDNLILLAFIVEQYDCTIITALDGQTTLELAQRYQPALILLDMMLPDIDGMEVFSHLRQNPITKMIPVIAVTAMAQPNDRDRILSAGFEDYVSKPYAVDKLESLLRQYLVVKK